MELSGHYDVALGAVFGACVGDAAGATLEFLGRVPTHNEVRTAMTMPGGGFFQLAPGQITDDGELTLSLAHALAISGEFDIEQIALTYAEWIRSRPFDIGETTRNSIGCFIESEWAEVCRTDGYAVAMTQAAYCRCAFSKANGSLMRASPLGVWGFRMKPDDLGLCAMQDSALSHPSSSCCQAVGCYTIAIAELVRNPQNRETAFQVAKEWAKGNANTEVCQWLDDAEKNNQTPYYPQAGFIRVGFTHAFRHLMLGTSYEEAITETLLGGGDTDTNACIVGGLVGAACGAQGIPDYMKTPVLHCDTQSGKRDRPAFLHAGRIPELVHDILRNAPEGSTQRN